MGLGARKQSDLTTTAVCILQTNPKGFDVYVGPPGLGFSGEYSNPYRPHRNCGSRQEAIDLFRKWFYARVARDEAFRIKILALRGMRLGCICRSPAYCHAHVIAAYLNSLG